MLVAIAAVLWRPEPPSVIGQSLSTPASAIQNPVPAPVPSTHLSVTPLRPPVPKPSTASEPIVQIKVQPPEPAKDPEAPFVAKLSKPDPSVGLYETGNQIDDPFFAYRDGTKTPSAQTPATARAVPALPRDLQPSAAPITVAATAPAATASVPLAAPPLPMPSPITMPPSTPALPPQEYPAPNLSKPASLEQKIESGYIRLVGISENVALIRVNGHESTYVVSDRLDGAVLMAIHSDSVTLKAGSTASNVVLTVQ